MRRRRHSPQSRLSHLQAKAAKAAGRSAQARRLAMLGRVAPANRDPLYAETSVRTRLVRHVTNIVDADEKLCDWVEGILMEERRNLGRPRELAVRTALIAYLVAVIHQRSFHVLNIPQLLGNLDWRVRRQLGIDYLRNGTPTQVSYEQLLDLFHAIADAFDAWDEKLIKHADEDAIRQLRSERLAEFSQRLLAASTRTAPMWHGNLALDATMKWSWERPPGSLNKKVERNGRDGDAGPSVSLSDILDDGHGEIDTSELTDETPTEAVQRSVTMRSQRKTTWPSTWSLGSGWAGRRNPTKAVHGIALHTLVRSDADGPALIEGLAVTPAAAYAPSAVMPLLRSVWDARTQDPALATPLANGTVRALGDVVADPAYTMGSPDSWQIPLRRMGASPVFRLHRMNQEGIRWRRVGRGQRSAPVLFIGGRPMCDCALHNPHAAEPFPKFPYTREELADYQQRTGSLRKLEWVPNGGVRPNGSRQLLAPHRNGPGGGGCETCVTADGSAVVGADGKALLRCCTTPSRVFSEEDLALWQDSPYGGHNWYDQWNVRNRVEGSYGVMKSLAVLNYGHDYHHFVGLARETLVAAFAAVAYNFHMLRTWRARQELTAAADPRDGLPSSSPTHTRPEAFQEAEPTVRQVKPAVGLEALAVPRGGPPPLE